MTTTSKCDTQSEYIKRDAVHDLVRSLTKYALASPGNTRHRITVDADDVNFGVDKIPSADVAPVRHGRWIERKSFHAEGGIIAKCSACQKDVQYLGNPLNFCPNCGSKMDI